MPPARYGCRPNPLVRLAPAVLALVCAHLEAETEIHRCILEDGTTAFQEMPCATAPGDPVQASSEGPYPDSAGQQAADDAGLDMADQGEDSERPLARSEPAPAVTPDVPSQDRAECEKASRDAIDAIDAEMRETAYTSEEGREYLAELLVLTRQLRACKQLPVPAHQESG